MAIKHGSFTFNFMYDDTDTSDEIVQAMDISDILEECDSGAMIGAVDSEAGLYIVAVNPVDVKPLLESLGNDGDFFDAVNADEEE